MHFVVSTHGGLLGGGGGGGGGGNGDSDGGRGLGGGDGEGGGGDCGGIGDSDKYGVQECVHKAVHFLRRNSTRGGAVGDHAFHVTPPCLILHRSAECCVCDEKERSLTPTKELRRTCAYRKCM